MPELRQPVVAHLAFPGTQDAGAEATFKGTGNRYSLIPGGVGDELADMTKPSKLGGRALDKLQRAGTPSNRVADLAALELAREIQTYKDEKAYELRTRVESDYGSFVTQGDLSSAITKIEEAIKPLGEYVLSQRGARESTQRTEDRMQPWMLWVAATSVMFFLAIITVALKFV